jgi:hypothetical protein
MKNLFVKTWVSEETKLSFRSVPLAVNFYPKIFKTLLIFMHAFSVSGLIPRPIVAIDIIDEIFIFLLLYIYKKIHGSVFAVFLWLNYTPIIKSRVVVLLVKNFLFCLEMPMEWCIVKNKR